MANMADETQPLNFFERLDEQVLCTNVDKIPGLKNARIVYFDGKNLIEIRGHSPPSLASRRTVVISPTGVGDRHLNQEKKVGNDRDGRFLVELGGAALSCGAAFFSWVVVIGSGAAAPISGGTSAAVTVLAWSAAGATSLQCGNSVYRAFNETEYGDQAINDYLDSEQWYQSTTTALDVISVLGVVASAGATLRVVLNLKKASSKSFKEILKGLNRHERKRLTEEIIRSQNPGISNKTLKALVRSGAYPARYSQLILTQSLKLQLKDAVGAALSFSGSATTGVIRRVYVGVIEELETLDVRN